MNGNKIILGTAQFGLDYGISNRRGKIPLVEVIQILNLASRSGIDKLDTAPAYGDSEELIGTYFEENGPKFKIISKLLNDNLRGNRKEPGLIPWPDGH